MLSDTLNQLNDKIAFVIEYLVPRLLNTGYFIIFYILVAMVYGYVEFGKNFTVRKYFGYLLPKEIYQKRSFRMDLYWEAFIIFKIPSIVTKLLSTVFLLHYVPIALNYLVLDQISVFRELHEWTRNFAYRGPLLFLIALFSFDFGSYWAHRMSHESPLLWQFHKVHHYGEQVNYFAGGRTHPIDGFISFTFAVFCMAICLAIFTPVDDKIFEGYHTYVTTDDWYYLLIFLPSFTARLHHSHFPITFGNWGDRFLVSPTFHVLHHSKRVMNKNYGAFFSLWDFIHGTAVTPRSFDKDSDHRQNLGVSSMGDDYYKNMMEWIFKPFADAFAVIRSRIVKLQR